MPHHVTTIWYRLPDGTVGRLVYPTGRPTELPPDAVEITEAEYWAAY